MAGACWVAFAFALINAPKPVAAPSSWQQHKRKWNAIVMSTSTPPTDPDSLAVLHALSRHDLSPEDAYIALEGLRNMAGRNVIAAIEANKAEVTARLDALRWMVGGGFAVLGILVALLRLLD